MLRILMLLLALLAALPAMAQSRENQAANALFVQVVREIQAAPPIPPPSGIFFLPGCRRFSGELFLGVSAEQYRATSDAAKRRHAALAAARMKLVRLVDQYPGSDIALRLMTGQRIGDFDLKNLEAAIDAAEGCIASPAEIERAVAEGVAQRRRKEAEEELQRQSEQRRIDAKRAETLAQQRPLSSAEVAALLRRRVLEMWSVDIAATGIDSFVVDIRVTLDASGVIKAAEIVKAQGAPVDSLNAFAQSARRAIFRASPLWDPQTRGDVGDGSLILNFRGPGVLQRGDGHQPSEAQRSSNNALQEQTRRASQAKRSIDNAVRELEDALRSTPN